jgi:hypothetical protein
MTMCRTFPRPSRPAGRPRGLIRWCSLALLLAALPLAGCLGGSGSSGFGITPLAENRYIDDALGESRCVDADGLPICPTDTAGLALPGEVEHPDPPPSAVGVQTDFGDGSVACAAAEVAGFCSISVHVDVTGLPPGAAAVVAARPVGTGADWTIGSTVSLDGGPAVAAVLLPRTVGSFQLAILVYFTGDAIAGGEIETLSQAGADIAFVSGAVDLTAP